MTHKAVDNKQQYGLFMLTVWCLVISSLLTASAVAQIPKNPLNVEPAQTTWEAPDLAALPTDWWSHLNNGPTEIVNQRFSLFLDALGQRVAGLTGEELAAARSGINHQKSGFDLLALARADSADQQFDPPLTKGSYFLNDILSLRAQWRELDLRAAQLDLQIEQSARQIRLLDERRDKLKSDYGSANPETPARLLFGIKRITARLEYELILEGSKRSKFVLKQTEAQSSLVSEQQSFARNHLINTDVSLAEMKNAVGEATARKTEMTETVAATQLQLLDALSADEVKPSLKLLRKQQVTRASSESELAELQELLLVTKSHWYQLRANELDDAFDLEAAMVSSRRFTADALKQAELWSSISQATLITPSIDTSLNTVKNYEIAQSVARDTLAVLDQVKNTSDDLLIIQDILTKEVMAHRSGLGNTRARLDLAFGSSWDRLVEMADYHLFNIGDTAVTPFGIIKMLFIMGFALGISSLIRYLLARGIRNKRTSQSPAFYTLGRILHYIIVAAGSFAALSSIGIDFASFALIAGALSVGIGFGLQAIVSNFVSGLILLFEGTLRVGDFIEVDAEVRGVVKEINTRATVINTNDGVDLVVPNSVLVTTQLTNWTLRKSYGRLRVSFGVAYGSDKELVKTLALEAIKEVDCAIKNMPGLQPQVRLANFGDSSLDFTVLFWVSRSGVRRPGRTRAEFLWALETLLGDNGVEIPFPQRDLHVKSDSRAEVEHNPDDLNPLPDLPVS